MGDPGLASKFIEMQQEDYADRHHRDRKQPPRNLDRSRILEQLACATHPNHITMLRRALKAVESK